MSATTEKVLIDPSRGILDPDTGYVDLFFPKASIALSGKYWTRGGLCWPRVEEDGIRGYAVLCGRHEGSGRVCVFREHEFSVIDLARDEETGRVRGYGALGPWLNECWAKYYCNTFFWHDNPATNRKYMRQALRSGMIVPKPVLPPLAWQDDLVALSEVYLLDEEGRLVYDGDGQVIDALREHEATMFGAGGVGRDKLVIRPALAALMSAVVGLDRRPRQVEEAG